MNAQAVIGAAFGDEGKGLLTDALCARVGGEPWVVRYNSSAQAGHTVLTPDGRRHVFHHWGSGSLAKGGTYLGKEFVVHPLLFRKETGALRDLGVDLRMRVDPRCRVATPFDVMVNQALEGLRGSARHGSCGIGFGEAIERSLRHDHLLSVEDLLHPSTTRAKLHFLRDAYLPGRLMEIGVEQDRLPQAAWDDALVERFLEDCKLFVQQAIVARPAFLNGETVIFEGAQGLLLDEELGDFPNVTRSKTGLPYVVEICEEAEIDSVDVTYVTRAYLTRHGAGPMPGETDGPPTGKFSDLTNVPNQFQGALRFAPLDPGRLRQSILQDVRRCQPTPVEIRYGLCVTCLDQMEDETEVQGGTPVRTSTLSGYLAQATAADWHWESWGPTRKTVVFR